MFKNTHNLLFLIPNTRKGWAKSLPRNWPRVSVRQQQQHQQHTKWEQQQQQQQQQVHQQQCRQQYQQPWSNVFRLFSFLWTFSETNLIYCLIMLNYWYKCLNFYWLCHVISSTVIPDNIVLTKLNWIQLWHQLPTWIGLYRRRVSKLFSPGIEPGTFCVLDRCDNRYTTKTRWQ